jgi:glycosidase
MRRRLGFFIYLVAATVLSLGSAPRSWAELANAWHIPDNSTDLGGTHMRNPEFEIANTTSITVYSGVQKFNNSFGTANQTGGTLYYKGQSQNVWQSIALTFDRNGSGATANNQYWRASFTPSAAGIGVDEVIQYYLYLTFDGANNVQNTYIYAAFGFGGDHASNISNQQSTAATSPFTIRNRPAFLFHSDNRVVNGTSVQFWTKAGYLSKDGALNWITNGALYYTTNGATPAGALGVAGANTQVVPLTLDHEENNPSPAGNATWWIGTVANLPAFTTIKYKIGLWNSSNNEEKFADYNASSDTVNGHVFSFSIGTAPPSLTVNGVEANYTTTHLFVDEINGDSIPLSIIFSPNVANVDPSTVQVFTNLNRRDLATLAYTDANGLATEEGISPPSGDIVGTNDSHYYKTYAMTTSDNVTYTFSINAQKTGAYRLTARYRLNGSGTWNYYSSNGRRDHAIVVSPKGARDINLYEINTLNIDASGDQMSQRSTFADLHNNAKRWNLNYLKNLGCNYLWFQPIHPNGIDGRQIDPNTSQPFTVGSPYAVKNFFEVMELMGQSNTRSGALSEFQGFVTDADNAGVGVMLDAPFNHTSYDCELAQQGLTLIKPGANATDQIRNSEARFYSRGDLFNIANNDYCLHASSASNIAPAPDRNDFGKFSDTFDAFFGNYAALVCHNNGDNGNYLNEGDWFDYSNSNWTSTDFVSNSINNNITRNLWRYFAAYVPFWLSQTGHSGSNSTAANGDYATRLALDSKGIDALRADFGQGLPPQCWEYIVNVARSHKWNFVFMSESLDGGAVTYRSNRHFDILNENIVFPMKSAATTSDYRGIFDQRRSAYGQGLVLLNNTSHDEENYDDPFQALIRYGVCNTIDGAPMIFYGQENGVTRTFGYSHYETNFGKQIPHFKIFNDLGPIIGNPGSGVQFLYPVYAAMGQARQFSRALRSSNRYYLNQTGGGAIQQSIFSVAKYETPNGSPASNDVVFAFVNLDRNNDQQGNFDVNITQNSSNLFGIKSARTYDVRNIAAYTGSDPNRRNYFLNRKTGSQLLSSGLFVGMKKVPTSDGAWSTAPYEAQYLKLYDVTAPSGTPGTAAPPNAYFYSVANNVTISWGAAPADGEGVIPCYKVSVTLNGNTTSFITCSTSAQLSGAAGQTLTVVIQVVNPSDNSVTGPSSSPTNIKFIDPNGDDDGDGMINANEDVAGTNPFDPLSIFHVTGITRPDANDVSISWSSVIGKKYQLQHAFTPGGTYTNIGSQITATNTTSGETIGASTPEFYRVQLVP